MVDYAMRTGCLDLDHSSVCSIWPRQHSTIEPQDSMQGQRMVTWFITGSLNNHTPSTNDFQLWKKKKID